jgi:hypothetical protein
VSANESDSAAVLVNDCAARAAVSLNESDSAALRTLGPAATGTGSKTCICGSAPAALAGNG